MRTISGLIAASLLALTACSGDGSDPAPEAEPTHQVFPTELPSEATAPVPDFTPASDPSLLLGPDGDLSVLETKVEGDLEQLASLHIEDEFPYGATFSYDVDQTRCSGEVRINGASSRFVTTDDHRMVVRMPSDPDRWVEYPQGRDIALACFQGPSGAVEASLPAGLFFLRKDTERVGVESVDGHDATHFRSELKGATFDTWIAADGDATRLLKLVVTGTDGAVRTLRLSEFDSADPVAPEPDTGVGA